MDRDYYRSSSDSKSRRPRASATRTINNNVKGIFNRRRNRGNKIKSATCTMDVDMGPEVGKDDSPRLSPNIEEKTPRVKPECQYSREELIKLMTHPLSSVKHPCLESPQNKSLVSGRNGVRWLEDRWDHRKHTDSLTDEDRSDNSLDPQKKRMNEPKAERLRKDQEVVLSPQRRSFNSGCFVNLPPGPRRPESPLKAEREPNHRDLPTRRIGSGRIMRDMRDPMWDFRGQEKEETSGQNNHDYNYRQRDDRFERRTYERSHEKDRERPQQRNPRYSNTNNDRRNKYDRPEPEEPEWFSGGPTSQHDTIELHGFDGPVDDKATSKKPNKNNKNNSKTNKKASESVNHKVEPSVKKTSSRKSSPEITEHPRSSSSPLAEKRTDPVVESRSGQQQPSSHAAAASDPNCGFDIDDFLNFDSLPPLLSISNGCVDEGNRGSGSRFSQFFHRNSPSPPTALNKQNQPLDSHNSSAHDEMFNSMINEITSTNIHIPADGDTYFAPISPAAPSAKEDGKGASASLLEMLQRGNPHALGRKITKKPSLRDLEASGKIHSVEELEAKLRQEQGIGKPTEHANRSSKEEELIAFRKLMMSKQVQNMQEQKSSSHSNVSGGYPSQQPQQGMGQPSQQQQQMPIPHDLVMKLLHVQQQQRQQEVFAKLLAPPARLAPSSQFSMPPPMPPLSPDLQMHISNAQPTKELLQRPEAQTILRSLKRGEITIIHLVDQLKRGSNLQPLHREILSSIIKLHGLQPSQREPSPGAGVAGLAPHSSTEQMLHQLLHTQQQQQQQLRIPSPHSHPSAYGPPPVVSPNLSQTSSNTLTIQHPHPVMQRVPSPRELVAHTQNILQNALLKKKLEEQKENFRKRQELQRSHSPNVGPGGGGVSPANTTSPTPLAFTPTSVLRKMTADKDGDLSSGQKHDAQHQTPKQESVGLANGPQASEMMRPKPFRQLPNSWSLLKPIQGRAIVKGNNNFSVPPPNMDFMNMPPQFKAGPGPVPVPGPGQRGKMQQNPANQQPPPQHFMMGVNHNRNIQNMQPSSNRGPSAPVSAPHMRCMGGQQQQLQQQGMTQSVQQLLMNHNYNPQQRNNTLLKPDCSGMVRGSGGMNRNYNSLGYGMSGAGGQDGASSPVSNQLARWFSPELLAQARAGKLPDMPPISPTQNMLSVEELERLQQAVHN